jgi:hypothetical protein
MLIESSRFQFKGFDIPIAYEAMRKIKRGHTMDGLWLINQQLRDIHMEKQRVESILTMIQQSDFPKYKKIR